MNSRALATFALAATSLVGAGAQQAPQPEPPPVFRVQVDAIEIDAFVTDAQGNPVTDLTADDFEILEDGRPQTVASFATVNIPIERAERPLYSPREIEPDVQTNTRAEGRLYVIALDEVNPQLVPRTRQFLRSFIERHFAANDTAAVVYLGRGRGSDTQDFTSNRRLLINAIDKFSGGFADMPPITGLAGAPAPAGAASDADNLMRGRMRALRDLTQFMSGLRGRRKTMIYVTETLGDVFSVLDYNGGARSIAFDDLHAAITAATRGNVSIYPVDPRGLTAEGGLGDAETAPAAPGAAGLARVQELRALAEATGGFAVANSNTFDAAFARIVRENSTYYVLGFTSTNERRDGRFRKVQVRVKRPGLTVRSRDGYLAPMRAATTAPPPREGGRMPAALAEALSSPIASAGVPIRVFAAPFKGPDREASVAIAIEMDAGALDLVAENGTFTTEIGVATTAVAAGGRVHPGQRHQARLTLRPESYERARTEGIRVLSAIQLPPGRYQLRVAGGSTTGRAGSVVHDLEIADFTRDPLVMSGVALTSTAAQGSLTVRAVEPFAGVLPGPISAAREFSPGDTITLFTEVYENVRNAAVHTVTLKVDLRTDDGRVVSTTSEERSSKELGGKAGGYGFTAEVPLRDVPPGIYVIHVEAQANMGARPTVARDIQIRVR